MKKLFAKYYDNIKDNFISEKNVLLFEGFFLILITTVCMFFNNQINNLTMIYFFPAILIVLSLKDLIYAENSKKMNNKNWIFIIIDGLVLLGLSLYLAINPINNKELFIILVSSVIIFESIIKLFIINKKSLLQLLNIIIMIILGALFIIFNEYIITYYLYFIILFLVYGIKKLLFVIILNNINKK